MALRGKIKLEKLCLGTVFTLIFFSLFDLQNASDCTDFDLGRKQIPGAPLAPENFPLFGLGLNPTPDVLRTVLLTPPSQAQLKLTVHSL